MRQWTRKSRWRMSSSPKRRIWKGSFTMRNKGMDLSNSRGFVIVSKFSTSILSDSVMILYNLVWDLLNNRKEEMKINRRLRRKNVFVSALLLQGFKLWDCNVKTVKEYNLTCNNSPACQVRRGRDLGWDDWSLFSLEYFMSWPSNEKECFPRLN